MKTKRITKKITKQTKKIAATRKAESNFETKKCRILEITQMASICICVDYLVTIIRCLHNKHNRLPNIQDKLLTRSVHAHNDTRGKILK